MRASQRPGKLDWQGPARLDGRHDRVAEFVKNQLRLHGQGFDGPSLICIDLKAYTTTQAPDRSDILNIGGFNDAVFQVVAAFFTADPSRFVTEVESIAL